MRPRPPSRTLLASLNNDRASQLETRNSQLANVQELSQTDSYGKRPALESLLSRLAFELRNLSETLSRRYLSHSVASRRMLAP